MRQPGQPGKGPGVMEETKEERTVRNQKSATAETNRNRARQAAVEALEDRRLLAADPVGGVAMAAGGTLNVLGTKGNDVIVVALAEGNTKLDVNVNGTSLGMFLLDEVAQG